MKRRDFFFTLAAPVLAAGLASSPAFAQGDSIRLGMTVSSTGTFALAAQSGLRGLEIWVDDVNARGGIDIAGKKRKVELVKLDDDTRVRFFHAARKQLPARIPVSTILFPLNGDPAAPALYWELANATRGALVSPSKSWPDT